MPQTRRQFTQLLAAATAATHPTQPILYTLHDLHGHLPRGAVSAHALSPTGRLTLLATQPLSLAATHPRLAAISPCASLLAVFSPSTGIYNILPLTPSGLPQSPTILRKDLRSTSPHRLHFPTPGTLLTLDLRHRPIHAFTLADGLLLPA